MDKIRSKIRRIKKSRLKPEELYLMDIFKDLTEKSYKFNYDPNIHSIQTKNEYGNYFTVYFKSEDVPFLTHNLDTNYFYISHQEFYNILYTYYDIDGKDNICEIVDILINNTLNIKPNGVYKAMFI